MKPNVKSNSEDDAARLNSSYANFPLYGIDIQLEEENEEEEEEIDIDDLLYLYFQWSEPSFTAKHRP